MVIIPYHIIPYIYKYIYIEPFFCLVSNDVKPEIIALQGKR